MEQLPQSIETWQAAVDELQLATAALAEKLKTGSSDHCPPLTRQDFVYGTDHRYTSLKGWQLNPSASPDYTWGAANPTRLAVGVDGNLYAAWWNKKHLFVSADEMLEHCYDYQVTWIADITKLHVMHDSVHDFGAAVLKKCGLPSKPIYNTLPLAS